MSKQKKQELTQTALLKGLDPVAWSRIKLAARLRQLSLTLFVQGAAATEASRVLGQFGKQAGQ